MNRSSSPVRDASHDRAAGVLRTMRSSVERAMLTVALIIGSLVSSSGNVAFAESPQAEVRFNRDIRPILSDRCFRCHGPDSNVRQAELRLDLESGLFEDRGGYQVVVPGHPERSELIRRITAADLSTRMPPRKSRLQLSSGEIELIRRWIEQGAPYERHWSFIPPRRPALPEVRLNSWARNAIDHFVLARLEGEGLRPSPEAEKQRLIRRVTLDLTGLPPTPDEVEAFLSDKSPDAYEKLVERLLASPRYGEKMATVWLDAARFADSGGYQGDILRTMWPWRDWVIAAYNAGLPFDRFTIEQLAGDLLPAPTRDQRIATGFNRNHRINDEDGIIFEEFRVEYVVDRVETTATVWLGLTMGCARCHDHKYDPISQRDFYRFFAYFNSVDEKGRGHGNAPPVLTLLTPQAQRRLDEIDNQLAALNRVDVDGSSNGDSTGTNQQAAEQQAAQESADSLEKDKQQLLQSAVKTMVMRDLDNPRETFVLVRGAYDRPAEPVTPGVPAILPPLAESSPPNRLGLAEWLVDPDNPLTARVAVNRYWQMYFGRALVATTEDFGAQGEWPTHPELLDWLATEFIRTGWDVKAMQRLIVTSATYRQSSRGTRELVDRDPHNELLARGPRYRLPAETIRDLALAASGLLVERLGGPSVRPYQPEGLWKELVAVDHDYNQEHGANLYRRSLYTFVRRTVPPPSMKVFDAPNREICTVRRARTNTPLQALALMNDPTYVEASRVLAEKILQEADPQPEARLNLAFRLLTARRPTEAEQQVLLETLQYYRARYEEDIDAAQEFVNVGEHPTDEQLDVSQLAAYAAVVSMIMNLDETITKE